jgi:hypothetical protein
MSTQLEQSSKQEQENNSVSECKGYLQQKFVNWSKFRETMWSASCVCVCVWQNGVYTLKLRNASLGINVGIIQSLGCHTVRAWRVPRTLQEDHKVQRMPSALIPATLRHSWPQISQPHCLCKRDMDSSSHCKDETSWVPLLKKFRIMRSASKVMVIVYWVHKLCCW